MQDFNNEEEAWALIHYLNGGSRVYFDADVPAPLRKCYGLRPGAPCPAYDDGTWPEGCACMNLKRYTGSLTWATAGIFFAISPALTA